MKYACFPLFVLCAVSLFAQSDPFVMSHHSQAPLAQLPILQPLGFNAPVSYRTNGQSANDRTDLVVADVNGDGKPDVIAVDNCPSNGSCSDVHGLVDVFLGNGDGTFQAAVSYDSGGIYPVQVVVADVNGDGKPDLLVANSCISNATGCLGVGTIGVLLGNGDGTFQTAVTYTVNNLSNTVSNGPFGLAAGDLNGDGKPDIAAIVYCLASTSCPTKGGVSVLLNNGDGTFGSPVVYASGGWATYWVTMADVNGDGHLDLLVSNQCANFNNCNNASLGVLLGKGNGVFNKVAAYNPGVYARSYTVTAQDLNGDGFLDLVVSEQCFDSNCANGAVGVLLGNGTGTFGTATLYPTAGVVTVSAAVGDVNGDGKPDLIAVDSYSCSTCNNGAFDIFLGNGDGTFQAASFFNLNGNNTYSVAAADVNGDGNLDVLTASNCFNTNDCSTGVVEVSLQGSSLIGTSTGLRSSLNPSQAGQSVTFSAKVTASQGTGVPTGTVSFVDGTKSLGSSSLNSSGIATLTTSSLAIGTHNIKASYSGDSTFSPSTSFVVRQLVQGAFVVLSPEKVNFGNQTVGTTSSPQNVTLTNRGNLALTISSIRFARSADFQQTNNCGSSVAAGGSCTFAVTFTPTATGTQVGVLVIGDSAPRSPQQLTLTGVGVM
ncbi:MAG TPA: FG-GAP-like repeat-containing protein [Candidatus Sulfotelmatobacter sp.]